MKTQPRIDQINEFFAACKNLHPSSRASAEVGEDLQPTGKICVDVCRWHLRGPSTQAQRDEDCRVETEAALLHGLLQTLGTVIRDGDGDGQGYGTTCYLLMPTNEILERRPILCSAVKVDGVDTVEQMQQDARAEMLEALRTKPAPAVEGFTDDHGRPTDYRYVPHAQRLDAKDINGDE